jgi:hypothetical protein
LQASFILALVLSYFNHEVNFLFLGRISTSAREERPDAREVGCLVRCRESKLDSFLVLADLVTDISVLRVCKI